MLIRFLAGKVTLAAFLWLSCCWHTLAEEVTFFGMCDASAGVAVNSDTVVVASDEDNVLRVYELKSGGLPVATFDLTSFFKDKPKEVDLEGSTVLSGRVFWIASHGRNKHAEVKPERHQLFAVEIQYSDGKIRASLVGKPSSILLREILNDERFARYDLKSAEKLAPEMGGINIEGLSATPDSGLLLGFRSPVPQGKALAAVLKNPDQFLAGEKAVIANPIELNLNGNGIRSIEYSPERMAYILVAGPPSDDGEFAVYTWSGKAGDPPQKTNSLLPEGLNPEAVLLHSCWNQRILLLSDDGGVLHEGVECKDLKKQDRDKQNFRGRFFDLQ